MKKFIASDLISFFHIVSAIASTGEYIKPGDSVALKLISSCYYNKNFEKNRLIFRGGNVDIDFSEKIKKSSFIDFVNIFFKNIFFLLSRLIGIFYKLESRVFLIHHTYFKPTSLKYVSYKDVFFVTIISFEEGVGTYGGFWHHKETGKTEGKRFSGIKFIARFFLRFFVDYKYKILINPKKNDLLCFQEAVEVVANYLDYKFDFKIENNYEKIKKRKIIFVSSKLVDSGILTLQEYKRVLERIHHEFLEYEIYVKPHPTEKLSLPLYGEFGFSVLDKNLPGEYLVNCLRPEFLVGFYSGLLLSANQVYECDYRIINFSSFEEKKIDDSVLNLFSKDKIIRI